VVAVFWVPPVQAGDGGQPVGGGWTAGDGHRVKRRALGGGGGYIGQRECGRDFRRSIAGERIREIEKREFTGNSPGKRGIH
jgi:hypothetical protein